MYFIILNTNDEQFTLTTKKTLHLIFKPHAYIHATWRMFYRTEIIADAFLYIAEIVVFDLFCSYDLDLDPMTFIYEHGSYSLEIYRMCKYELPTLRLSKVIVWLTNRQTSIWCIGPYQPNHGLTQPVAMAIQMKATHENAPVWSITEKKEQTKIAYIAVIVSIHARNDVLFVSSTTIGLLLYNMSLITTFQYRIKIKTVSL